MKYIRTKDGRIYEIIEETENSFELCSPFEKKMGCNCIMIKRILGSNEKPTYRLADTIEELCDVAIIWGKRYNEPYYWWFKRHEDKPNLCKIAYDYIKRFEHEDYMQFDDVYGAIWTNKGLIYVAKMNEKGELELL